MAINLTKKQGFDLTKRGVSRVHVGLSWDATTSGGTVVDCDASVVMLAADNKLPSENHFVFFNNLVSGDGAVRHMGDNRDGAADGDDEIIDIDLGKVGAEVTQILFVVTIHEAEARGQHFGNVSNASIRILKDSQPLCQYMMAEVDAGADSMVLGAMVRDGSEWTFAGWGHGFSGGLAAVIAQYQ